MHARVPDLSAARPLLAFAIVLMMTIPALLSIVAPVGGVVVNEPEGDQLPIQWEMEAYQSTMFDITLPPEGVVTSAQLTFEGDGLEVFDQVDHNLDYWTTMDNVAMEGLEVNGDSLVTAREFHEVLVGEDQLGDYESINGLAVDSDVRLDITSPAFSGANGSLWRYYQEIEVALNSASWEYDTVTYMGVDIPEGHCSDTKEIRIADPSLREVPYQLAEKVVSKNDGSVIHIELITLTDMPPDDPRPYRVYYGNPQAEPPGYKPILLGAEMWEYGGLLDPNFVARWDVVRWPGDNRAGRPYAGFLSNPHEGNWFEQKIDVSPSYTFSQVWTDDGQAYTDFQLFTWVRDFAFNGSYGSFGMFALDFRIAGQACYRFAYTRSLENGTEENRMGLYYIPAGRHLTDWTSYNRWVRLEEKRVGHISNSDSVPILIRAKGSTIQVWTGTVDPILEVTDNRLASGKLGTFVGGYNSGYMMMGP